MMAIETGTRALPNSRFDQPDLASPNSIQPGVRPYSLGTSNLCFRSSGKLVWASQLSAALRSDCSHWRATFSMLELRRLGSVILATHGAASSGNCQEVWLTKDCIACS